MYIFVVPEFEFCNPVTHDTLSAAQKYIIGYIEYYKNRMGIYIFKISAVSRYLL